VDVLLVFVPQYDLNTHQFDVKIALLNDDLDKPISMAVPKDSEKNFPIHKLFPDYKTIYMGYV
jgi:hypothetical protein